MLTNLLIRLFVKDHIRPEVPAVRLRYGLLAGGVGIAVNLLLFGIKLTLGLLSGSIAMAADAVNNLADGGNSLVTVFGFKFSAKPPDNEHPFGHGRLEYVAGVIVSVLILAVGFNFFKESVVRIFSTERPHIDNLLIGIFAGTMLFKFYLFLFYRRIARTIQSQVVRAAAFDSLSDLLATSVVLLAAWISRYTSFPVDGVAGAIVAVLILLGGAGILRDTINPLLGECPDKKLVRELRERLLQSPGICGVHDIIIHNYGPNHYFATAHAEVDRNGDLMKMHDTLEHAEVEVAKNMPIRLVLHCDPYATEDPEVKDWRARAENATADVDPKFKLYDFRLEKLPDHIRLHFHLLIPRNYLLESDEITRMLTEKMRPHASDIELKIDYINAFV